MTLYQDNEFESSSESKDGKSNEIAQHDGSAPAILI